MSEQQRQPEVVGTEAVMDRQPVVLGKASGPLVLLAREEELLDNRVAISNRGEEERAGVVSQGQRCDNVVGRLGKELATLRSSRVLAGG